MWQFIDNHFEGIVALALGAMFPIILWGFRIYRNNILDEAEETLNGVTQRFDTELSCLREKLTVLKETVVHLTDKQHYLNSNLKEQLDKIETELKQLDAVKEELQGTRELMLLQHNTIKQQLDHFKEFCKEFILSKGK